MRSLIVHPQPEADQAELDDLLAVLDRHPAVARVELFDTGRARRAHNIGKAARGLPPRRDLE